MHLPLPVDDPTRRRPDITLARTALGWEPTTGLQEGLARTATAVADEIGASGVWASTTVGAGSGHNGRA